MPSSTSYAPAYLHVSFFFFNDTATTEIYTLSLHDALPIYPRYERAAQREQDRVATVATTDVENVDRKSTRLNSSHLVISYAVFCLKKKTRPPRRARSMRRRYCQCR